MFLGFFLIEVEIKTNLCSSVCVRLENRSVFSDFDAVEKFGSSSATQG